MAQKKKQQLTYNNVPVGSPARDKLYGQKARESAQNCASQLNKIVGRNQYIADSSDYGYVVDTSTGKKMTLSAAYALIKSKQKSSSSRHNVILEQSDNNEGETMKFDFGGYVTKPNLRCSDGRIIHRDAFIECDNTWVPLVWNHLRNSPENVVGRVLLEHRNDGTYGYAQFNDTEQAKVAKELVRHKDIDSLSIYANHLTQKGSNVMHGVIREVSLVMAGANPEAKIDNISIEHSDGYDEILHDEALIYAGIPMEHSEIELDMETDSEEEIPEGMEHADDDQEASGEEDAKTVKEVFDSLTDDQKALFYAMVGEALNDAKTDEAEQSDIDEGGDSMSHNIFEGRDKGPVLEHSDIENIFKNAKRLGSLKEAVEDAAIEHGITDIESLFPDYKSLNNPPAWIGEPEAWVNTVWNGTSKTPFSRIKSQFADITKDEARARGYIKGKQKIEEQFSLLKRTTDPQTVYKKQSLDRDDIIDITDFDVVAWLKSEMRMKLQEELSRAVLLGDGRLESDDSKIQETHIRSVLNDDPFYSIKAQVDLAGATDTTDRANAIIDAAVMAMIDYKGSGSVTAFMSPQTLATLRLAKDKNGRRIYNSVSEIASALGVSNIVEVPLMKDQTRKDGDNTYTTLGILVNLRDYTIGADKGGATTMFDDFDIDYNKYKYLIETRCSGALTKPASAIVLETSSSMAAVG